MTKKYSLNMSNKFFVVPHFSRRVLKITENRYKKTEKTRFLK